MTKGPVTPEAGNRRLRAAVLGVATLLGCAGSIYLFRGCSATTDEASNPEHRQEQKADSVNIPRFGKPEEARRYFSSMTDGDQRAILLLDEALAKARQTQGVDAKYVADLERERGARAVRLEAYKAELARVANDGPVPTRERNER